MTLDTFKLPIFVLVFFRHGYISPNLLYPYYLIRNYIKVLILYNKIGTF